MDAAAANAGRAGDCARGHVPLLIVGAGPAGLLTAMALKRLGWSPRLIGNRQRPPALEGLSGRAGAGLRFLDCRQALATVPPPTVRQAFWNDTGFSGNGECLIDRRTFDAALWADAAAAGIELQAARVRSLRRGADGWRIGSDQGPLTADFLIDARGRRAGRADRRGPLTTVLCRPYRLPSGVAPGSWLCPCARGWAWFALDRSGRALAQLAVANADPALPGRRAIEAFFDHALASIPRRPDWLAGARAAGPVYARTATTQLCSQPLDARYLRVGDAALAVDPLSGHGIFEAAGSALAAAAVVNTVLRRPAAAGLAAAFYHDRLQHEFWRMARVGRDFYRQERRWAQQPFWQARQGWPDQAPAHAAAGPARLADIPVSVDGFIETRRGLITPDQPRGLWQLDGIPLVDYLQQPAASRHRWARQRGARAAALTRLDAWLDAHPVNAA